MKDEKFRIFSEEEMFVNLDWTTNFLNFSFYDYIISEFGSGPQTGWVRIHRDQEDLYINDEKAFFYPYPNKDEEGNPINGLQFIRSLQDDPLSFLHPNIADAMLANQKIVPGKFKKMGTLHFWGKTFYLKKGGFRFVKGIIFENEIWKAEFVSLSSNFVADFVLATC